MIAFKLLRVRKDSSLGPLFINRKQRIPLRKWLRAENHPTKGFSVRPGWHCCAHPHAPHLSMAGRVWAVVEIRGAVEHHRPEAQGGLWYTAKRMKVLDAGDPADLRRWAEIWREDERIKMAVKERRS